MKWTVGNIIDLEYFLRQDNRLNDDKYLKKRDRDIYLNSVIPQGVVSRKDMLLLWLKEMKKSQLIDNNKKALFIGDMYEEFLSLLKTIFMVSGGLLGIVFCLTFFSYKGSEPLNVAYFFTLVLLPQISLLAILLAFFSISKLNTINKAGLFPYPIVGFMVEKIFMAISKRVLREFSAEKRDSFLSAIGVIRQGEQVYGFIFFYPIFIVMQIFGMAFNVGILLSTLFRVLFFDTAFGWQSTLQISPQVVAKMVELAALPWGWLMPAGFGYPDIDQIVGSRIILKDGIYHLTTNNLVSWWPFLSLCVLFYGFLPRFIMFIAGKILLNRSLKQQNFDHAACSNLIRRMAKVDAKTESTVTSNFEAKQSLKFDIQSTATPVFKRPKTPEIQKDSIAPPDIKESEFIPTSDVIEREIDSSMKTTNRAFFIENSLKPSIAFVPDEIQPLVDIETFKLLMEQNHGYNIQKVFVTGIDFDKEIEIISNEYKKLCSLYSKSKKSDDWRDDNLSIVILQEAWQPPIRETINFIKSVRKVLDKTTPIVVALTGKSDMVNLKMAAKDGSVKDDNSHKHESVNFFTSVEQSDWDIWKNKLSTVSDPWLTIEKVV